VPHGKLLYPSQGLVHQTDENHQIFDPRKIPRGRSTMNHQLKFQHQQIFKNNRRPQFYNRKLYQQNFNDQTPHQLAKQCQHNSEESIKMSKE
jgi:hypothetical protein